jgi:hypothetical protein
MMLKNCQNVINIFFIYLNGVVDNLNNLQMPDSGNEDQVFLNLDQFMEIMTNNIIKNRETFGRDKIVFESGTSKNIFIIIFLETSNVGCMLCPYQKKDEQKNDQQIEYH